MTTPRKRRARIVVATCPHCGYEWVPRVAFPVQCPDCGKRWPLGRRPKAKGATSP